MVVASLAACGPVVRVDPETSTSSGHPSVSSATTIGSDDDDDGNETPEWESSGLGEKTGAPGEGSSGVDATNGCGLFICEPDGGGMAIECNIWEQDCPKDQKCMPWANDGSYSWNATKCVPLDPTPGDLGDPCTVEDSPVSGIDDCKLGAICWDVDLDTNTGECFGLCQGSEANPTCEFDDATCVISGSGVLALCLPFCDPLLQDCDEGEACYPVVDSFRCEPDQSGDEGAYGDACDFLNVCDPGLFCANPEYVPGCDGNGCCTPFCDISDPNATAGCPGAADAQECVAWYEEGQAPPGHEYVGGCLVPQ